MTIQGIPITVGNINDLFVATPNILPSMTVSERSWNITHIPSGHCYACYSDSPEDAVRDFERALQNIGKRKYQKRIKQIMAGIK
jgi:hypothetical protein